jgi:hypothetical protein
MNGSISLYVDNRYLGANFDPIGITNISSISLTTYGSVMVDDMNIVNERLFTTVFQEDFIDGDAHNNP